MACARAILRDIERGYICLPLSSPVKKDEVPETAPPVLDMPHKEWDESFSDAMARFIAEKKKRSL